MDTVKKKLVDRLNMTFPKADFATYDMGGTTFIVFGPWVTEGTRKKVETYIEKIMHQEYDFTKIRPYAVEWRPF